MVLDLERADLEASKRTSQDFNEPLQHPQIPTLHDEKVKATGIEGDSTHSRSSDDIQPTPLHQDPLEKSKSKTPSTKSHALSVVPRSKRRGLLGRFTLVPEVGNPVEYDRSVKWFITTLIALAAAAAPTGSAVFLRKYFLKC